MGNRHFVETRFKSATSISFCFTEITMTDENKYKTGLIKRIKKRFPGSVIFHLDPTECQGAPDLLVLYKKHWAALEGKKHAKASKRPNQDYYVEMMNEMSFSAFIFPENKEDVLNDLELALTGRTRGSTRVSRSK